VLFLFYGYNVSSISWQLTTNVTNDDCDNWFGTSLSILDDGMIIGCPRNDGGIGAAFYYKGNHSTGQLNCIKKSIFKRNVI
jgi:hypothetical protein